MSKSRKRGQPETSLVEQLATAIAQAARIAKFVETGCLRAVDPGLEVEGLGQVSVPLQRGVPKQLIAACGLAPYGKGTETLVDTRVRKTYELDPERFRLSDEWNAAIANTTRASADALGLPMDRLEAKLYKLLVYEKGGFFLPHRDSEKHDRMVASLIVVLPNPFVGGRLIVRHGGAVKHLGFEEAATGKAASFAAFYADCEHEVERVRSGVRIALAYNLVLNPEPGNPSEAAKPNLPVGQLVQAIKTRVLRQPTDPLVFALDHHYTQRGLSLDLLKGTDRELADLVVSAATNSDCLVHLAQVTRHLSQHADDGSFDYGRRRYSYDSTPPATIQIGETYDDVWNATEWADLSGQKQPWGEFGFDLSDIVSTEPIDDWQPTTEEYEGYTGNAGNTLDRWYHRSALIVWHRDRHFEILASPGAAISTPLFCSMTKKLAETPKEHLDAARNDCVRFASAIIAEWPRRPISYGYSLNETTPLDDFPTHLLILQDRDLIAAFLTKLAEQDERLPLESFVMAACREFGWTAFGQELKHLIARRPNERQSHEIPLRDVAWFRTFCFDPSTDPGKSILAGELCQMAATRFCEPLPSEPDPYATRPHRNVDVAVKSLPLLLKALTVSGRDEDLTRVIKHVRALPNVFSLDLCQVPELNVLIPWSRERLGTVPPPFKSWLDGVREHLERITAKKPTPPTDWARPAVLKCQCQSCAQVKAFLADPTCEVCRIPAVEHIRQHLIETIDRNQCDVTHSLLRTGRPFSLELKKTMASFQRAVLRYEQDLQLLRSLPSVS